MAKIRLLVDTDVFIDYLNHGQYAVLFESADVQVHYAMVTRKELMTKPGLADSEKRSIESCLKRHRAVRLTPAITRLYGDLRKRYPRLDKEDALIAATALSRRLPLVTRNRRHFRFIENLRISTPDFRGGSGAKRLDE